MAIAYGTSTTGSSAGSTAPSVSTPASTAAGDHLYWGVLSAAGGGAVTPPSGFTAVPSGTGLSVSTGNSNLNLYTKLADGTEGGTLTGSLASSAGWLCFAIRTTGTNIGIDVKASGSNGDNGAATATIPAITTLNANELIYLLECDAGLGFTSYTPDGATTEVLDIAGGGSQALEIAYKATTTATSYGSWVNTAAGGTYPFANHGFYFTLVLGENLGAVGHPTTKRFAGIPHAAIKDHAGGITRWIRRGPGLLTPSRALITPNRRAA